MQETFKRRKAGRPLGTIRGVAPLVSVRYRLAPETAAIIDRCSAAAGMSRAAWLKFTLANLESKGQLLNERREQNAKVREMNRFINAIAALLHSRSIEGFLELAKNAAAANPNAAGLISTQPAQADRLLFSLDRKACG